MEIYSLKNFSKDELLDIYWNLKYGIWDSRMDENKIIDRLVEILFLFAITAALARFL